MICIRASSLSYYKNNKNNKNNKLAKQIGHKSTFNLNEKSEVYRIQKRHPVAPSIPSEHNTCLHTQTDVSWMGSPFTLPVQHIWSVQILEQPWKRLFKESNSSTKYNETPHTCPFVVVFEDQGDAANAILALHHFFDITQLKTGVSMYPRTYDEMLFAMNLMYKSNPFTVPLYEDPSLLIDKDQDSLNDQITVMPCEYGELQSWAILRNIGLIVVNKIKGPHTIQVSIMPPPNMLENELGLKQACFEDFDWQL